MDELVSKYINNVAYAVGYSLDEQADKDYMSALIDAGLTNMKNAGVSDDVLNSNSLVLTTLIIVVSDNMNMNAGAFNVSPLY